MTQILLRGNYRFGMLCVIAVVCVLMLGLWTATTNQYILLRVVGGLTFLFSVTALGLCWRLFFRPRISIAADELLVYIRSFAGPFRVPLDIVEVFFMGQGAVLGTEPGHPKEYQGVIAANVIVRLAESATDWQERDALLLLGVWRDGYITVRGLWCEDIDQELLKKMNKILLKSKQKRDARNKK